MSKNIDGPAAFTRKKRSSEKATSQCIEVTQTISSTEQATSEENPKRGKSGNLKKNKSEKEIKSAKTVKQQELVATFLSTNYKKNNKESFRARDQPTMEDSTQDSQVNVSVNATKHLWGNQDNASSFMPTSYVATTNTLSMVSAINTSAPK